MLLKPSTQRTLHYTFLLLLILICPTSSKQFLAFFIVCREGNGMLLKFSSHSLHCASLLLRILIRPTPSKQFSAFCFVCKEKGDGMLLEPSTQGTLSCCCASSFAPLHPNSSLRFALSAGKRALACCSNPAHREFCTTLSCCCASSSAPLHPNSCLCVLHCLQGRGHWHAARTQHTVHALRFSAAAHPHEQRKAPFLPPSH